MKERAKIESKEIERVRDKEGKVGWRGRGEVKGETEIEGERERGGSLIHFNELPV